MGPNKSAAQAAGDLITVTNETDQSKSYGNTSIIYLHKWDMKKHSELQRMKRIL